MFKLKTPQNGKNIHEMCTIFTQQSLFWLEKMSKFNTHQKWENIYQVCTKWEVHIFNVWSIIMQSLNIHKLDTILAFWREKCSTPIKNKKKSWNVHKIGGAHLQYVNSFNKKEWKLLELQFTQTRCRWTDRRSGSITRPAFTKETQVKIEQTYLDLSMIF